MTWFFDNLMLPEIPESFVECDRSGQVSMFPDKRPVIVDKDSRKILDMGKNGINKFYKTNSCSTKFLSDKILSRK